MLCVIETIYLVNSNEQQFLNLSTNTLLQCITCQLYNYCTLREKSIKKYKVLMYFKLILMMLLTKYYYIRLV